MSRTDFSDVLPMLARQYPLPGLRPVNVLPVTGRNLNAIMADATGARFVMRCYLRNVDPARIRFQLDFQQHLHGKGTPTADIIATDTGERIVSDGRRNWVLFRYIDGAGYDPTNEDQLRNAARCLADLHDAAEDFVSDQVMDDTIPDVRRWWTRGAEDLEELNRMFAGRDVDTELDFLDSWRAGLVRDIPLGITDQLPKRWVHADFHGENLAFVDDEVTSVFDFDVVHQGFRLEDIAHGSFCFSRENATSNRTRPRLATMFQEHFDLTDLERAVLPAILVATQARNAARYRVREREGADPAAVLRRHVARMRKLADWATKSPHPCT